MTSSFVKLLILAIISIVVLVIAGLANDWLRDKLGIKSQPAQPQPAAPSPELVYGVYPRIGKCLTRCINNSDTGLLFTRDPVQNHVAPEQRVLSSDKYPVMLVYKFQRIPEGGVNTYDIGSRKYNTFPIGDMVRILNQSLMNYCIAGGCFPVVIVAAKNLEDGYICLAVAEPPAII